MFGLPQQLREVDRPVRVGILGAGQFGTKCLDQLERIDGLRCAGIADPADERIATAVEEAGLPDQAADRVPDTATANEVIAAGQTAILADGTDLASADLDVVLEATGDMVAGARHAVAALTSGTHVVMATCEADAVVGPLLGKLAATAGLKYTPAYGMVRAHLCA